MAEVLLNNGVITVDGAVVSSRMDLIQIDAETGQPVVDPTTQDYVSKYGPEVAQQIATLLLAQMPVEIQKSVRSLITECAEKIFKELYTMLKYLDGVDGLVENLDTTVVDYGGEVFYEALRQTGDITTKYDGHKYMGLADVGEMVANINWTLQMLRVLLDPDNAQSALNSRKVLAIKRAMKAR